MEKVHQRKSRRRFGRPDLDLDLEEEEDSWFSNAVGRGIKRDMNDPLSGLYAN